MNAGQRFCLRSQKSPVAMSPQDLHPALDAQAGADDDLGAGGPQLSDRLQGHDRALRLAPALRGRRFARPAADVAVGHGLEPLDDVALVRQAAAEHVGQDRGCAAGNRYRCVHGAVSFVPMVGNGGDALPRTSDRRPASARLPSWRVTHAKAVRGSVRACRREGMAVGGRDGLRGRPELYPAPARPC